MDVRWTASVDHAQVSPSHLSLVLRLLRAPAGRGELVGQVEVVDTGESVVIHGVSDLQQLASRVAAASIDPVSTKGSIE